MTSAGRIGIGTTNPSTGIHVAGSNVYVQTGTATTGQNLYVAVSAVMYTGGIGSSAASTDGINWDYGLFSDLSQDYSWQSVTGNPTTGIFAAVASGSTAAASSTNGINWIARTLPSSSDWQSVTVNPTTGIFAAVASGSTAAASSTDGFNWIARTLPSSSDWKSVTVNPTTGVFVAIPAFSDVAAYSTDGINWSPSILPYVSIWNSVTVNPTTGVFVAVSETGSGYFENSASSTNGINWTARSLFPPAVWTSITSIYTTTVLTSGSMGLGVASPSYQLDLSTDGARKLTTTTWLTGSDARIKTDVESANLQMCYETVKSVDLKYFKWNFPEGVVPDDKHSLGFIAQEVKDVFPNAVSESNSYGFTDFLNLNVDQLNKALFGAVKYLAAKVEALEARMKP